MADRIELPVDLPPELQNLIEKRDQNDRRKVERRQTSDGPVGKERRSGNDRRQRDRRGSKQPD